MATPFHATQNRIYHAGAHPAKHLEQSHVLEASPWKKLARTAIEANNRANLLRDVSMNAVEDPLVEDALIDEVKNMDDETKVVLEQMTSEVRFRAEDLAGVTAPLGFFDPLGFSTKCSEGKLRFYREVEIKHGRVGMLASVGILVGEQWHPLWGGNIDVPSYIAFQETPLQTFWPAVVAALAIPEVFSVFTFNDPTRPFESIFGGVDPKELFWTIRPDHEPGDLGFDPLGLKPTNPEDFKDMQTKELTTKQVLCRS